MKTKQQRLDAMLEDGTITCGRHSDGRIYEHGKPVGDLVVKPMPKVNAAPKITDPPKPKVAETPVAKGTGLMRAINANLIAQGKSPIAAKDVEETAAEEKTGLARAIAANVAAQKK